ncbi:MAG: glycoside hydrolase [Deltaproteobacteria bacterium]|nr:glycoside hydrolase [Deltaproteobacteria bacterium]
MTMTTERAAVSRRRFIVAALAGFLLVCPAISRAQYVAAPDPIPRHERRFIEPSDVLLHWTPPDGNPSAIDHYVVALDEDEVDVAGDAPDYGGDVPATDEPSFAVGALEIDKTYYWRVDTVLEDATVVTGDVWSFETEPLDIPGVVVDYSPDPATVYYMSPSLALLPDGTYIASHDMSGPGSGPPSRTVIFESKDRGRNWVEIAVVEHIMWANLFWHDGALYLMGTSGGGTPHQQCVIHRSDDEGHTWTEAVDSTTGILFEDGGYHTAPVPMAYHNGRLWRAMEDTHDPLDWPEYFRAFVMSAPDDADLLDASNWTATNRVSYDESSWYGRGWLEGNAVVTPTGEIVDILRISGSIPSLFTAETAAVVHVSADGTTATFDPETDYIDFPGGGVKFTIRFDEETGLYWSLVNKQREPYAMRNRVALTSSPDLVEWTLREEVLKSWDEVFHAWQYIDWHIDGDDLLFVARTAHPMGDGLLPHGYHDANFTTFHRVTNFRDVLDPGDDDDDTDDDTSADDDDDDFDDDADDDSDDGSSIDDDDDTAPDTDSGAAGDDDDGGGCGGC